MLQEIRQLQTENSGLAECLESLTDQRNQIIETLRQHMKQCSDYQATQNASVGLSHRVLKMLGLTSQSSTPSHNVPTAPSSVNPATCPSPSIQVKEEALMLSVSSPLVVRLPSTPFSESSPLVSPYSSVTPTHTPGFISAPTSPCIMPSPDHSHSLPVTAKLLATRRNSSQGLDTSATFSSSQLSPIVSADPSSSLSIDSMSENSDSVHVSAEHSPMLASQEEQEEEIVYRHKLMKHRSEWTDFTKPSPPSTSRNTRAFLERSYSFPSSSSETRTYSSTEIPAQNVRRAGLEACRDFSIVSAERQSQEVVPLDLRKAMWCGSQESEKPSEISTGENSWRPLERRWSVDEPHSCSQPMSFYTPI